MMITLRRIARKGTYTIGKLYVGGVYICDTLEDTDRGLSSYMAVDDILKRKVKGSTCIPTGLYIITLDVESGRFKGDPFYAELCNGKLPRLLNVKGFEGVLIHSGNTSKDTEGCILVGENKEVGKVVNSRATFRRLYKVLAEHKSQEIYIRIE